MSIINPLPFAITPNTLADANQVQGNFNSIVTQVNANAAPGGSRTDLMTLGLLGATAVTGTAVICWVSNTKYNDALLEITSGPGGTNSGGFFTPSQAGTYEFIGSAGITTDATTTGITGTFQRFDLYVNGVGVIELGELNWPFADSLARTMTFPIVGAAVLGAGNVVTFRMTTTFTGGTAPSIFYQALSIRRIA